MAAAYIGLGSNLGDSRGILRAALRDLGSRPGVKVTGISSFYRTAPVGYKAQPDFINAAAELETGLDPRDLLRVLQDLEHAYGRERLFKNGPRTLDLDLLLYGRELIAAGDLSVPHPRLTERAFVLVPLNELAPGHPVPPGALTVRDFLLRLGPEALRGVRRVRS